MFLWWRGGVFVLVFLWGFCFVFVVVFLWWCFCGGVAVTNLLTWHGHWHKTQKEIELNHKRDEKGRKIFKIPAIWWVKHLCQTSVHFVTLSKQNRKAKGLQLVKLESDTRIQAWKLIIRWVLLSQTQHLSFGILHEHQGKVILVVAKRRPTKVWRCRGLQCGRLNAKRCPIDNMEVFDIFCANCNFNLKIDRKLNPDRRRFPQRHSLLAGDQPCVPQAARASANRKARDHADAALLSMERELFLHKALYSWTLPPPSNIDYVWTRVSLSFFLQ